MSEFSTLRPQHTHSGSDLIVSGAANACPICLAKELTETKQLLAHKNDTANTFMAQVKRLQEELAEAKRTNERLVELLRLGMRANELEELAEFDREVRAELRRLGLNV